MGLLGSESSGRTGWPFSRVAYSSPPCAEERATLFWEFFLPLMMVFYNRRPQSVSQSVSQSSPVMVAAARSLLLRPDERNRSEFLRPGWFMIRTKEGREENGPKKEASCSQNEKRGGPPFRPSVRRRRAIASSTVAAPSVRRNVVAMIRPNILACSVLEDFHVMQISRSFSPLKIRY